MSRQARPARARVMARRIERKRSSRARPLAATVVALAVLVVGALAASNLLAGEEGERPAGTAVAAAPSSTKATGLTSTNLPTNALLTPRPQRTPETQPTPTSVQETPTPADNPTPLPRRTPRPTPTADPNRAPTSNDGFDLQGQVIDIAFPLRQQTRYHYRNNFLDPRDGTPDAYNHVHLRKDGKLVRAHDGTDIYADQGEPLIAVFSGTVVDPKTRWRPWEPDRYGRTIALVSDDPRTDGYTALYVHADHVWVSPGEHVDSGQVLGTVGRTGNADGTDVPSHLHFELRAPFLIDWTAIGEARRIDAFNPFASLVAADPKR